MARAKSGSETVAASQARVIEAGGAWLPKTLLQADDAALWARAKARHGGSAKDTIVAALRALEGRKTLSNAELVAEIAKRLG